MWWDWGRFYWGSKEGREGIVVVFAWLSSQERHLKPYVQLYSSFGWRSLHLSSFQLIDQQCKGQLDLHDYQLVKDSLCGQIYDSTPVDFTSDLGTRFVLHPSVLKRPHPPRVVSWMAKALATGLDTLFISRFEAERADYWQTLYSSVVRLHFLSHICLSSLKLSTFFF
ncbi:hypothetical protein GW17_00042389 [Ensete ventricosum]|nr:hypothetical protein GW17_00042389 [Ensete ventricosum]